MVLQSTDSVHLYDGTCHNPNTFFLELKSRIPEVLNVLENDESLSHMLVDMINNKKSKD